MDIEENVFSSLELCELDLDITQVLGATFTASVSGGVEPYIYEWSTGEITSSIDVTYGQEYALFVSGSEGCIADTIFTIDSCTLFSIDIIESPVGTFSASTNFGTAPFMYQWSNGETGSSMMDTLISTVYLTVTDAINCSQTDSLISSTSTDCVDFLVELEENPPGTINTLISGGTAPFAFFWNTGQGTSSITVTEDGMYGVIILDDAGCFLNLFIQI